MTAPHRINVDLGLPVIKCEQRRPTRAERIGELILDLVLAVALPLLVLGCLWARWVS